MSAVCSLIPRAPRPRILALALAALLSSVLAGCAAERDAQASTPHKAQQAVSVRTTEVRLSEQGELLRFAGVVQARERATLTFQVGGVLRERPVELGQTVGAGDLLARLFNPELDPAREAARARVNEVLAQAEQARLDTDRAVHLHARGMLSAQERDREAARLQALRASVASARAVLNQTEQMHREMRLEAPFGGTIEALLVEPGEYVTPGQAVMRMAAESGYELTVHVPASLLDGLSIGERLPIWANLNGDKGQGRIIEIGRSASQGSVLYPLVLSLDDSPVRVGDALEVGLTRRRPPQAAVPFAAVMRSADGLSVFRLEGERVRRVSVEVAGLQGEWALLEGHSLQPGDHVVHSGLTRLADNDLVRPLP